MSADRVAIIETSSDGRFVNAVVSGPGAVAMMKRHAAPGSRIEVRPARPGETTATLVAELADAERDPNAAVSRLTLPIRLSR